jgi:AcrR family transcriptional regulator
MVSRKNTATGPAPDRPLLSQAFVDEHKRERCALALADTVHEVGVWETTVALVTKRAQVARTTFYGLFTSQKDALRYACELGNRRLREAIERAAQEPAPWNARVEAAVEAMLEAAQSEPHLIELCLLHGSGRLDPRVGPHDEELIETLVALLAEGRRERENGAAPGELLAHGVLSVIARRLRRDEAESLSELSGQLTEFAIDA